MKSNHFEIIDGIILLVGLSIVIPLMYWLWGDCIGKY
jgi:hypothetical protein